MDAALVKLRQFGELQAQQVAAYAGQFGSREENQTELLGRLKYRGVLTPAADLFHTLRKVGNVATHDALKLPTRRRRSTVSERASRRRIQSRNGG